jgi:hypothetical protein
LLRKQITERKKFILFINNEGILKREKQKLVRARAHKQKLSQSNTPLLKTTHDPLLCKKKAASSISSHQC